MAVDPKLRNAIMKKVGVTGRHVDRLIADRARHLMLTREQAAIAIAAEYGISVTRFATADDLAVIRAAKSGAATPVLTATPAPSVLPVSRGAKKGTPNRSASTKGKAAARPAGRKKVFVVHGRDEPRRKAMFSFLRSIGLSPIEWSKAIKDTGKASPYVGEVLDAAFQQAVAVVVLMTPDDLARLKPEFVKSHDETFESTLTGQARPNVLFEAGMAFGRSPDHTVLVQIGSVRPFSDVGGRHVVHMNNSPEQRTELANRLANAGCEVDLGGTDWGTEGDFS